MPMNKADKLIELFPPKELGQLVALAGITGPGDLVGHQTYMDLLTYLELEYPEFCDLKVVAEVSLSEVLDAALADEEFLAEAPEWVAVEAACVQFSFDE